MYKHMTVTLVDANVFLRICFKKNRLWKELCSNYGRML